MNNRKVVRVTLAMAGSVGLAVPNTPALANAPTFQANLAAQNNTSWHAQPATTAWQSAAPLTTNTARANVGSGFSPNGFLQTVHSAALTHAAVSAALTHQQSNSAQNAADTFNLSNKFGTAAAVRSTVPTSKGHAFNTTGNDFNLTSSKPVYLASTIGGFDQITIQVGNNKEVVNLGSKLTAGELVAVQQVLNTGTQTIKLNGLGAAVGGTISLDKTLLTALDTSIGGSIGTLTIARNVQVIDSLSVLSLGNLTNYGSIVTASSTTGSTDIIRAGNILNAASGSINSYTGGAGLYGADVSLNASNVIVNNGKIGSTGDLTLTAPVIYNVAVHNSPASLTAQNVNINTADLTNNGTIAATTGNINVASTTMLNVTGSGAFNAAQGNVNFNSTNANLTVSGGNYNSEAVNMTACNGDVTASLGKVSGQVNAGGVNIHVTADTDTLKLGNIDASGDPLFANKGNIVITGDTGSTTFAGQDLTIIAGGNITSDSGFTTLDTSSTTGKGGNVTVIAGVNYTGDAATGVTLTGASSTGGFVNLSTASGVAINTSSTAATAANAGYVQIAAFAGSTVGSGTVTILAPDVVVGGKTTAFGAAINATSSPAGGSDGAVQILAGSTATGNVIKTQGSISAGSVLVKNSAISIGSGATFMPSGTSVNGLGAIFASAQVGKGDIDLGSNIFATGNVSLTAGGAFSNEAFQIYALNKPTAGSLNGAAGANINITASGDILVGNLIAAGGGGTGSGSGTPNSAGGNGGNGGTVNLTTSGGSILIYGNVNTSGGGGGGGAGNSETHAATAGGAGGIAGSITLSATKGSVTSLAQILAYDGGAGGAGGTNATGVGGGGGGGSAVGGGGGGGGGGLGTVNGELAAGGGGGLGGIPNLAEAGAAGGGGASVGNGSPSAGGTGGSTFYGGGGGTGNFSGFNSDYNSATDTSIAGAGGSNNAIVPYAAGATSLIAGGAGGQTAVSGIGTGSSGGGAAIVANHGVVSITAATAVTGSQSDTTTPVKVATGGLVIVLSASSGATASIVNNSGTNLNVTASGQANSALTLTTADNSYAAFGKDSSYTISGNIPTVSIDTTGSSGVGNIVLSGTLSATKQATLTANALGSITANVSGLLSTPTAILSAGSTITLPTAVTNLTASAGTTIAITQTVQSALNVVTATADSDIAIIGLSTININGAVKSNNGNVTITDTNTGTSGILLGGNITAQTGTISIIATSGTNNQITTANNALLTANSVVLQATGSIGTSTAPVLTKATTITALTGPTGSVSLTDSNTGNVSFDGGSTASTGTLTLKSSASSLNVVEAPFDTVNITNSSATGGIVLNQANSASAAFGGAGTFTITANGSITAGSKTQAINGSTVSLTSTAGSIGQAGSPISVASPILKVSAKGAAQSAYINAANLTSLTAATGSGGTFSLSSNNTLTIDSASSINASILNLSAKGAISVNGPITANSVTINSTGGVVDVEKTITGSGDGSTISITGFNDNGTAVIVNAAVTASTVNITGKGIVADVSLNAKVGSTTTGAISVLTSNNIIGTKSASLNGAVVTLTSTGGAIGQSTLAINTVASSLAANSSGATYISQTGDANLQASSASSFNLTDAGSLTVQSNLSAEAVNLTTTGSAKGITIVAAIGSSTANVALTATGAISLGSSGNIAGNQISLNTASLDNQGSIVLAAGGQETIQNTAGALIITGKNDSFSSGVGGSLLLNAKGAITVGTAGGSTNPFSQLNTFGALTVTAGGVFTSPVTAFNIGPAASGNGGTINIQATNLAYNGATPLAGPISFSANSSAALGKTGGAVVLNLTGTATSGITIGNAPGNYQISATGTIKGGDVTIVTPGLLTLSPASLDLSTITLSAGGNNINLTGTKGVLINGTFNTTVNSAGANISITSGSTKAFTIGGTTTGNANGQINVAANEGIFGLSLSVSNTGGVVNNATIGVKDLTISANGASGLVTGATGGYTSTPLNNFNISSATSNVTLSGAQPQALNTTISAVKGAIALGAGVTSLGYANTSGAGGTLSITAKTLTQSSAALSLIESGSTNQAGGTVNLAISGTSNLKIGSGAITINVSGNGTGANGNVNIATGGNLTADISAINLGAAKNSGNLALGGKILHVSNLSTLNTVNLKTLALTSNSASFILGGAAATANGIGDVGQTVSAQQLTITNNGGTIIAGSNKGVTATGSTSPAVTLSAKGDIGATSVPIIVNANGNSSLNLTSTSGNAYISVNNGDENLTTNVSKTLQITNSAGKLSSTSSVLAKSLILNATDVNLLAATTNATTIGGSATAGAFQLAESQTAAVTLNAISAAKAINITTGGALTVAGAATSSTLGAIDLKAGGAITTKAAISGKGDVNLTAGGTTGSIALGANVTAGTNNTATITAAGKGNVTESKTTLLVTAKNINVVLGTGNVGTSHTAPLKVAADTITVNGTGTTGSAYINNSNTATGQVGTSSIGKLFDYTGSISASTEIDAPSLVIATGTAGTMSGILTTSATTLQIAATNGVINVQDTQTATIKLNALTASAGGISIISGGGITTAAAITGEGVALTTGGDGNLVVGNSITAKLTSANLTASGKGTITDAGGGTYKAIAPSITLTTAGANIGTATVPFKVSTPSLVANTGTTGNAYIVNSNTSSSGGDKLSATVGALTYTDTNTTAKNSGTLTIGNITASTGAITIASNEKSIFVDTGADLETTSGNISIQNTFAASGTLLPYIGIKSGAIIHASVVDTTNLSAGNVYIALGTLPTSKTAVIGTTPGPNTPGGGGDVRYATTANPTGSITTTGTGISLNGTDRLLAFSTGKIAASQIELFDNVTITADPPAGAASPAPQVMAMRSMISPSTQTQPAQTISTSASAISVQSPEMTGVVSNPSVMPAVYAPAMPLLPGAMNNAVTTLTAEEATSSDTLSGGVARNHRLTGHSPNRHSNFGAVESADQSFDQGVTLLMPQSKTTIQTSKGNVTLDAGTMVLLVAGKDGVAVYDMHDGHKDAVSINLFSGERISLRPGQSVMLTDSKKTFGEINPVQYITYRGLSEQKMSELRVCKAEFDLLSAIGNLQPIGHVLSERGNSQGKAVATKMLKTAAILNQISQRNEPFTYQLPASVMAFAPQNHP